MSVEQKIPKGTTLPSSCKVGDQFMLIVRSSNQATLHMCFTDNTWTAFAGNDPTLSPAVSV